MRMTTLVLWLKLVQEDEVKSPPNLSRARGCCDCTVHSQRADSCTVSDRSKHTRAHTHISPAVVTSPLAVSLNTGSSLHAHCCLCRNDLEISGLSVILCLSHKPRRNMTRALWRFLWRCLLPPFQSWKAVKFFNKMSSDYLNTSDFVRDGACS